MACCGCGCGTVTQGDFVPGHDQVLRIALEKRVGGVKAMQALVEAMEYHMVGDSDAAGLTRVIRNVYAQKRGGI